MNISFQHLCIVSVEHAYYAAGCRDFAFVNLGGTAELMRRGRLLAREVDGRLHVLYEVDEAGAPSSSLAGETLFLGLRQLNASFSNFTSPVLGDVSLTPLFTNGAQATAFDAAQGVRVVSSSFAPLPQENGRPVRLQLSDARGHALAVRAHAAAGPAPAFDLRSFPTGVYSLLEDYGGGLTRSRALFLDGAEAARGVWGILALRVDASFYAQAANAPPLNVALSLGARSETLKYYIVAPGFDVSTLSIDDEGSNGPGASKLGFAKAAPDLPASVLGADLASTTMFSSLSPVARSERGLRKLHLKHGTETFIEHLPQPGAERSQAQLIIRLTKS
jgi:hypothetical protein